VDADHDAAMEEVLGSPPPSTNRTASAGFCIRRDYLSSAAWHEGRARAIREAPDVDPARERQADRASDVLETRLDGLETPSGSSY
jgi:hypothetical protein